MKSANNTTAASDLTLQRAELSLLPSPQCEFCRDTGIEDEDPCGYCHTGELAEAAAV